MTRKTTTLAFTLAAGLLTASGPALAHDETVAVLRGQTAATAVSVTPNEGGAGVTVVRGSSSFVPGVPAAAEPVAFINGEKIRFNDLEPTGNWFLDRSGEAAVIVHCYTRQSVNVGGGRRILCDARQL